MKCLQYTCRGTPRIALLCDASAIHSRGSHLSSYNIWQNTHRARRFVVNNNAQDFFQIWHFASLTGTLSIVPNHSKGSRLSSYNIWQNAKYSWHAAKSTPPVRHWSQLTPYLTSMTNKKEKKSVFHVQDLPACKKPRPQVHQTYLFKAVIPRQFLRKCIWII